MFSSTKYEKGSEDIEIEDGSTISVITFTPMTSDSNNDSVTHKEGSQDRQNEVYKTHSETIINIYIYKY